MHHLNLIKDLCVYMYACAHTMYSTEAIVLSYLPHTVLQEEMSINIDLVLTFAPSDTNKHVQFPIADDALEPDEAFVFQLVLTENVPGVLLRPFDMTNIIIRDDGSKLISTITPTADQ